MKKSILIKGMITSLFFIMSLCLSSCVMGDESPKNTSEKRVEMKFRNDIFYFNRYERVDGFESDTNNIVTSFYEQGNIEIYGNVIKIKKTSETDIYFIQNELYNDTEQVYTFTCKKVIVEFSVTDRTIEVKQMNEDSGEIFYINSTIKSNW